VAIDVVLFPLFFILLATYAKSSRGSGFEPTDFDVLATAVTLAKRAAGNSIESFVDLFEIERFPISESHAHRLFELTRGQIDFVEKIVLLDVEVFV
jgi:hypothetical protein